VKRKTLVVTGSSSGIGYAIAQYFTQEGHQVFGLSRSKPIQAYDWQQLEVDLSKEADIHQVFEALKKETESIDVWINCAGMGYAGALEESSLEEVTYLFQVNLFGPMALIKGALPFLRKSEDPRILNIGSVASEITIPFQTLYSMSKSAMMRMTEGLRMELKPEGIQVTTILPGDTKTPFTKNRKLLTKKTSPYYDRANRSVKKMAKDEEKGMPVHAVVHLVSKQVRKKKMPVYKTVGLKNKAFVLLAHVLPSTLREKLIYKIYAS
jgi:short-subunit dehydrogenase